MNNGQEVSFVPKGMPPAALATDIPGPPGQYVTRGGGMGKKGLAVVATITPSGYPGIESYLEKLGPATNDPRTVLRVLQWQQEVNVNRDRGKTNAFKAKVESLLVFQAFLMMREGRKTVTVLHSLGKYFAITAAMSHYQGRYIGFVGGRILTQEPGPVLIPALKGWEWVKKTVRGNRNKMCRAYENGSKY